MTRDQEIKSFIQELSGFAQTAEATLTKIEQDLEANKGLFSAFYERMFAIRGTALQLNLAGIAKIAELGEEISAKATHAEGRPKIRKCVGCLWDALTTIKYLLEHHTEETTEEQTILVNRLEDTLRVLGGRPKKITMDEIDKLLNS